MIKHTRITATFGNNAEEGYNINETYVFNMTMSGICVSLYPCGDTPVLYFETPHDLIRSFKLIEYEPRNS